MTPEELKAYRKAYNKERYEFLKSKGICTKCGAEKAKTGKTMCLLCLDKQRETALKSAKKCRNKETYNAYMKEFRDRRKEKGLCQWCGNYTTYYEDAHECDYDYCLNCGAKMDLKK